jgi:hypothetical protein
LKTRHRAPLASVGADFDEIDGTEWGEAQASAWILSEARARFPVVPKIAQEDGNYEGGVALGVSYLRSRYARLGQHVDRGYGILVISFPAFTVDHASIGNSGYLSLPSLEPRILPRPSRLQYS